MQFRDIRASCDTLHFGASLEEGSITIWKSDSPFPIASVKPGFSGGENRQLIDPETRRIYAGTWEDGITCFDYAENRVVWHRADLIGIQKVDLSKAFSHSVFVTLECPDYRLDEAGIIVSGIAELSVHDGSTRWLTESGDWLYLHPSDSLLVVQDSCDSVVRILNGAKKEVGTASMIHFSVLDVAFRGDLIALAEGEKGVRVLDHRGALISRFVPQRPEPNCVQIAFDEDRVVVLDTWESSFVSIVDPHSGKLIAEYERDSHEAICFLDHGSRYVDSSGKIFRSSDGVHLATLSAQSESE